MKTITDANRNNNNDNDPDVGFGGDRGNLDAYGLRSDKESEAEMDRESNEFDQPTTPFRLFLEAIHPIDMEAFSEMSWYNKIYEIAKVDWKFALQQFSPLCRWRILTHSYKGEKTCSILR